MIISRTPLRVSLVGGGTDMPSFYEKHPGACLSFAINKYVYVALNDHFVNKYRISYSRTENVESLDLIQHDLIRETLKFSRLQEGFEVVTVADIPGNGTGLGSSSAMIVGLLKCLHRKFMGNDGELQWLAKTAFFIEAHKCHKPVGKQDHYATALGGFNLYIFSDKEVRYTQAPFTVTLERHMLLLWTGIARKSEDILTQQKERFASGNTLGIGKELAVLAETAFYDWVQYRDIQKLAEYISYGWEIKKKLAPWITNEWIDDWYAKAMNNGAWGGKLCGAGGGGFLLFMAPPDTHDRIVKATGLRKIDFKIENEGSKIIYEA